MIELNKTVWFDPNGMESGSQRAAQLRGVARRRGGAAHQRVCGEAGLERQTAFLYLGGRGHNGARGGHSLPKRDEVDGRLHVVGCWVAAAGVRAGKKLKQFAMPRASSSSSKRDAASVSALWEDKRAQEVWRHSDDGPCPSCPGEGGADAQGFHTASTWLRKGGVRSGKKTSPSDATAAPAASVLASHRMGYLPTNSITTYESGYPCSD